MGQYVILSRLTDEGRKTLKKNPDRVMEVNQELEAMGVRVLQQFAVMGEYDFVNIVEAPDNETIMKMSVELGARGSVQLLSLPAVPVEQFIKKIV
ncbi:MAG: GYD domain-containing protein [Desulfonatronovibrionaceae bacterium]